MLYMVYLKLFNPNLMRPKNPICFSISIICFIICGGAIYYIFNIPLASDECDCIANAIATVSGVCGLLCAVPGGGLTSWQRKQN